MLLALLAVAGSCDPGGDAGAPSTRAVPAPRSEDSPPASEPAGPDRAPPPHGAPATAASAAKGVPPADQAPAARPWNSAEIAAAIAAATADMRALGAYRRPRAEPRGPGIEALEGAYAAGRAMNWRGSHREIREWTALAKFGVADPRPGTVAAGEAGPLAGWDLTIVTRGEQAFLHAALPPHGPREGGGAHQRVFEGARTPWVALCDRATPDVDYLPYKRDGSASLHHQWGDARFIDELVELARDYRARTGVPLGIGDISHVTGGKLRGHWTHREGIDADLYLLRFPEREGEDLGPPTTDLVTHRRGEERWTPPPRSPHGPAPTDPAGTPITAARLTTLAELTLPRDTIAYFVHDATQILAPFDTRAQARRPGRRFLHRRNQGYWPPHPDHVHLRWSPLEKTLPQGPPRP